jgi:bifunctional DNase/RNase
VSIAASDSVPSVKNDFWRDRLDDGMRKTLLELHIRGVSLEKGEPIVILEERRTKRRLHVKVGPFEASAIILELEGISSPRPLTHDLLAEIFKEGGFSLDGVELFGYSAELSRAKLSYSKSLHSFEKEVRPSDALALAQRLKAPIFASPDILAGVEGGADPWLRSKILDFGDWKTGRLRA